MIVVPNTPWTCSICAARDQSIFVVLACGHGNADDQKMHISCLWRTWTNGIKAQLTADQVNFTSSCPFCRTAVNDNALGIIDRQAFDHIDNPPPGMDRHYEEIDGYRSEFEQARYEIERAREKRAAGEV